MLNGDLLLVESVLQVVEVGVGVSTNWRVNGVADCVERITERVIGVRWLFGVGRRLEKTAFSVVVYLDSEVLLGVEASFKMVGKSLRTDGGRGPI